MTLEFLYLNFTVNELDCEFVFYCINSFRQKEFIWKNKKSRNLCREVLLTNATKEAQKELKRRQILNLNQRMRY